MASSSEDGQANGQPDLVPHYPLIRDYLRRFAGRDASADDLTHQTYFRAYRGLDQGSVPCDTRSWLFSIARNVGYEQMRRDHRYRGVALTDALESVLYDESVREPVDGLPGDEAKQRLRAAINGLNQEERIVLHACCAPDRHLFDPVTQFGLTPGLAKVRAYRLRKKLRKALE